MSIHRKSNTCSMTDHCLMFTGYSISTVRLREEVDAIVLGQKVALSNTVINQKLGFKLAESTLQYQNKLKQYIVDLHSLGYPIISFYVDYPLSSKISNHPHTSLLNTMYKLAHISSKLEHSCLQYTTPHRKTRKSVCGIAHIHNPYGMPSMPSVHRYKILIMVPHIFYVQLQFLEIALVGGLTPTECNEFQAFRVWHGTMFPFSPTPYKASILDHLFCGTHHPFTTIVPGNIVIIEGNLMINNTYASIKLRYSVIDILVSTK